jgi:hypothetical protein
MRVPPRSTCAAAAIAALLACTPEAVLVPARNTSETDSAATDTTGTDTTVVQRGTLTITGLVAPQDSAIASRLGWTGRVLPGAEIRARRASDEYAATADATGRVTFTDVLPGIYQVSVLRVLADAERALLAPEYADVSAFGGGGAVTLTPPLTEAAVAARGTRRGSLVISEMFPITWMGNEHYYFGTYIELYNNADTTVYLDGKLVGRGPFFERDAPEYDRPCSLTQQWQADSLGVWSGFVWRLPGTGRQYPLAPGEAAVLAADAVDHSVVDPRWPDLSGARFEFLGASDVDNPAAGNITVVGTPYATDFFGHGPWFTGGSFYIADSVDVSTLPHVQPPNYRVPIPRIPREKILDFVYFRGLPLFYEGTGYTYCALLISPRKPAGSLLLRSGSTVNDFEIIDAPTPGRVR